MWNLSRILDELNVFKQCEKYNFKLAECPTFLFPVIGFVTILAMIGIYVIADKDESPEAVVIIVSSIAIVIFGVGNIVIKSVERIALANQSKTEFINIASHQLKAPLAAIRWTGNLLSNPAIGRLNDVQMNYVKTIEQENNRMIRLVNDLLNVARIESGKIGTMLQCMDLGETAIKTIGNMSPIAEASNIKIRLKKENNLPEIFADPAYVQIAVENLIGNAIKYTKGKGEVDVVLKRKGKCVEFKVRDKGVGIPFYQQGKVFDKFFRSDNAMKYQTEGTGLGLFIAKAIIDSSNGKIGFKSVEGKETTFWFTIPICSK